MLYKLPEGKPNENLRIPARAGPLLCRKIRKSQGHGTEATLITPHARPGAQG